MTKLRLFFLSCVIILPVAAACTAGAENPVPPASIPVDAAPAETPLLPASAPVATVEPAADPVFPGFSITDPNSVCLLHFLDGISCVDSSGWRSYGNDETSPVITIPRAVIGCPDGEIWSAAIFE